MSEAGRVSITPAEIIREFTFLNRTQDIEKKAKDLTERQLREEMRRGSAFNPLNWARKIRLRVGEEYYRQVYTQRAREAMLANNNSYLEMDVVRNAAINPQHNVAQEREAGQATIERVREEGLIEGESVAEAQGELKEMMIREIIRPAVEGRITDLPQAQTALRSFIETHQNDAQIQAIFGRDTSQFGRLAEYFATDLMETAEAIKGDLASHKYAIDQLDNLVKIKLANTRWAAETQARFTLADRAIRWAESRRLTGALINPATLGAGFAIGIYGAMRAAGIGGKALQTFAPGVGAIPGALFAGFRRNYDLKVDRASHQRERTYNEQIPQGATRREALERFAYHTSSVNELLNGGGQELTTGTERKSVAGLLSADLSDSQITNREAVIRRMAEIQTRLDFSARENVDLITYAGRAGVEQGRLALIRAVAQGRETLKKAGVADSEIEQILNNFRGEWNSRFIQNTEQQNRAFSHFRLRNAVVAGVFGGAAGLGAGFVSREVLEGAIGFAREHLKEESIPSIPGGVSVPTEAKVLPLVPDSTPGLETKIPEGASWIPDPEKPGVFDLKGPNGEILVKDANFRPNGFMQYNQNGSIPDEFIHQIEGEKFVPKEVNRPVFGPDGLWDKNISTVNRTEWYAYNTPFSERNELKFFTIQDGDKVTFDTTSMKDAFQTSNKPPSINVPDVINNHELSWRFTMADGKSVVVSDGADGAFDGRLILDPNADGNLHINPADLNSMTLSDFSRIIMNQEALHTGTGGNATEFHNNLGVWNLGGPNSETGYISAGRLVEQNGAKVWQSFATIRGTGTPPPEIPGTIIEKIPTFTPEISMPPPPPEFIPFAGDKFEAPFIPIPFAPRHPLEKMDAGVGIPEPPPVFYYGGESLTEAQSWIKQHPEAHKSYRKIKDASGNQIWVDAEGKPIVRNVEKEREEIEAYLKKLETTDPSHSALIHELTANQSPMKNTTRVVVNVPAWMEGKNLYRLLDQYTKQIDKNGNELDANLYEINIIVNRKKGTPADNSVGEIEKFKADTKAKGKNYNINYVDVEFDEPFNNVGNARRVITDITLIRSLARTSQTDQLYIESEDGDLVNVDPKTVINLIESLDNNPHLDAVRGIQDRLPEAMMENDYLFLYRRAQDFKEMLLRRGAYRPERNPRANYTWNRVITGGWNTGFTAQAYAMIGGYNPYQTKGEDMIMGERFSMARGDGIMPNTDVIGKVPTRSDSSPRRYIWEAASGKAAYGPDFEDESVNKELRDKSPEELMQSISHLARLDDPNASFFQAMLNNEFQFIRATTPNEEKAQSVTQFALMSLGFKREDYEFKNSKLIILEWANVKNALNNYRVRHKIPPKQEKKPEV